MVQPEKAPCGTIKWKALYDNDNPLNRILIRNTHDTQLLPWYGYIRQRGNDQHQYTCIPITDEQHKIITAIETALQAMMQQHDWSKNFTLTPTQKIYPKSDGCMFYEKREDGRLHRTTPDVEGELHNTPERSLTIGALIQLSGIYYNFANLQAKVTYRMVSATYQWTSNMEKQEEVYEKYLSVFGEISSPSPEPVEASIIASGDNNAGMTVTIEENEPDKKEAFQQVLMKTRTVGGIAKCLRKVIKKKNVENGFIQWCEAEAHKATLALEERTARKKAEQEPTILMMSDESD